MSRITFIDLDKLMKRTKEDAQMRVRMSDRVRRGQQQGGAGRSVLSGV